MALLKRNTYSRLVSNRESESEYTPEDLWMKAIEYFRWSEDNPLKEEKVFSSGKKVSINKMRAMSITGFCVFANLSKTQFEQYSNDEKYSETVLRIKDIIYMQKFEGAAAGLLETTFVAREMGLRDQTDITTNGKDIHIEVIDQETKKQLDELRSKLTKEQ